MKWLMCLVAICLSFPASAGEGWPKVPAEVWAIKEGPKGAVVLEERIRFQLREMETIYRVRIFSDEGRDAAMIPDLPKDVLSLKGRTVYPDGREIVFDSRKDFAERKVEAGGRNFSKVHLVAPGVTSDCVVEVRWRDRSDGYLHGLPKRMVNGLYGVWTLGNPYPTRVSAIEVAKHFPLAFFLTGGRVGKAEDGERDGFRVITFRDLPARENLPYAIAPTIGFPRLELYWQPDFLIRVIDDGNDGYWSETFDRLYRSDYETSVSTGGAFKRLAEELTGGLPEGPQARATALLSRLEARIRNVSSPTAMEKVLLPKDFWSDYDFKRLDKAAESGMASAGGMRLMYYHLLKKAGLQPKIGKLVDREQALFNYSRLNAWQFHHEILGIAEAGKPDLWVDPTNRYAMPGVIHPDYQAVPMLVFEPNGKKDWKPVLGMLPASSPAFNTRAYEYELKLEEDADRFEVRARFGGYPEFAERYRYLAYEAPDQSRLLKEQFEARSKSLAISKAVVHDASNPAGRLSWEVTGSLERESGRRREVLPFPGMTWPLWVPDKLDAPRTVPIVLPYLVSHDAICTFTVPEGYRFNPHAELRNQNAFGTVAWSTSYEAQARRVTVRFQTEVASINDSPARWNQFREFLGWIQEACTRTIILAREG